jgi:hypothetical protein
VRGRRWWWRSHVWNGFHPLSEGVCTCYQFLETLLPFREGLMGKLRTLIVQQENLALVELEQTPSL